MDKKNLHDVKKRLSENEIKEDFLHCVNLENLKKEVSLDLRGIAEVVEMKNWKGLYKWSKSQLDDGTRPSYNALIKLLQAGATVETLFGVEYKGPVKPPVLGGQLPPELASNPEFTAGQQRAFKDIESKIEARITAKLKAKGIDL